MYTYILQVSLCWSLFALLYLGLLQRETFFQANRAYLLITVVLGLVLPVAAGQFPVFTRFTGIPAFALPEMTTGIRNLGQAAAGWSWAQTLNGIYWAGFSVASLRLLYGLSRLIRLALHCRREYLADGSLLVRTDKARLPFSFFRWIFVSDTLESRDDFQNMLAHERAHVRGGHSFDVLGLELLCVLFWFHPLAHWYRKALRSVHEYLADAAVAQRTDARQYALLLLRHAQPGIAFANHFFQAPLKSRLVMLTRKASPKTRIWKYVLAVPLALLLWSCNQQDLDFPEAKAAETPLELSKVEKLPEFPGGTGGLMQYLGHQIHYPDAARQEGAEGYIVLRFLIHSDGAVGSVEPVPQTKPVRQDMTNEAIRVIKAMPRWTPAYKNGAPVSCIMTLPIRFKLE